jgi:hypothetical protein
MPKRDDPDKISQLCSYFKNLPWFTENMGRSHLTEKIFPICSMDEVSVPNKATYPLKKKRKRKGLPVRYRQLLKMFFKRTV